MLRELTIHGVGESREDRRRVVLRRPPPRRPPGTPRSQADVHSGVTRSAGSAHGRERRSRRRARGRPRRGEQRRTPRRARARGSAGGRRDARWRAARAPGRASGGWRVAKPATRTVPAGSPSGSRSARAASTRREDRHGVVGEAPPGGRQPDAAALGLDQRRARLAREHGELLRDRRGRVAELVGDRTHRAAAGELEEQAEAVRIHRR